MWSGEFVRSNDRQEIFDRPMKVQFPEGSKSYLTRLETRMDPAAMTEDIRFMLDPQPNEFSVRIQASDGWGSELTIAARNGETETVQKLVEAGADLDSKDDGGMTALIWAAKEGHTNIVLTLLEAGADVNVKDKDGCTALMSAARYKNNLEVISVLLEAGADAKAKNKDGMTAFDYAQYNSNLKGTDAYEKLREVQ